MQRRKANPAYIQSYMEGDVTYGAAETMEMIDTEEGDGSGDEEDSEGEPEQAEDDTVPLSEV